VFEEKLKGRTIALIGGAGFIGHNLALALKRHGALPHVIDGLQVNNLGAFTNSGEDSNKTLYVNFIFERMRLLREAGIPLHVLDARDYPKLAPTGNVPICPVISTPAGGTSEAQRVMAALISGSTRTLYISNAYFVPPPSFIDALCAAKDRGVDVRVLIPGPYHDEKAVQRASRHTWPRLVERGIGIYEYQTTMMHAKTVVVDGELFLVGSINFDPRSFALNAEFGVVVVSRDLAADRMRSFEADLERATRVTPETIASFGVANRALDALCYWARAQL